MESVKQNLQYVKTAIEKGEMKKNAPMLLFALNECTAKIKATTFQYEVNYVSDKHQAHFRTVLQYANRFRAKLLTDVENLEMHIKHNKGERICLQIIKKLLDTNLYMDIVRKKASKSQSLLNKHKVILGTANISIMGVGVKCQHKIKLNHC